MTEQEVRQRLAAVLAADVAGYSRLMGDDEPATIATLRDHRDIFRGRIEAHGGRVVDMAGDAVLAIFSSASGAVTAGIEAQQALRLRNADLEERRRMHFRVGINLGDIHEAGDGTIYGDGVNVAARIEALATPGAIAISDDSYRQIRDRLHFEWRDGGEHKVKNIARAVRIWHWSEDADAENGDTAEATAAALPLPDRPSIAVLPFNNMSGDPDQEYFADGITEDIITDISKVSGLFVIARNSSFAYKGQSPDIRRVCEDLGVRYVLEGSVRKAGNRVRINAQLIEGSSGGHVWADRYDGNLEDIFAVQDDVTREIVDALKVTLTTVEQTRREGRGKVNPEAYDCLVRARAHLYAFTKQAVVEGRAMVERAIELDPDFAPAYATLSLFYSVEHMNGWNDAGPDHLKRAVELAQKSLATDSNEPQAYHALALAQMWRNQLADAESAAERAIELDPNFAGAYAAIGSIRDYAGQHERAVEALRQALRHDPEYHVALQFMGRALFWLGRYDEAEASFKQRLIRSPRSDMTRAFLASLYGHTGRQEEARRVWAELLEINPDFSVDHLHRVLPYADPAWFDHFTDGLRRAGLRD